MGKIKWMMHGVLKNALPYAISVRAYPHRTITEGKAPMLFNAASERVLVAYLQDKHISHSPYTFVSGRIPKRIFWDHYNHALPTQFYSHKEIFHRQKPEDGKKQFGILLESENIVLNDYDMLIRRPEQVNTLAALFTHSERLLDKYPNACIIPGGGVWYGTEMRGGTLDSDAYLKKSSLLSIVSSTKQYCPLHSFRIDLAKEIERTHIGDVMGTIVNRYVKIGDSLTDYMYSVGIENAQTKYYYTEKLMNCFASMTVPVYYGATEIGKFFNPDGIIEIKEPSVECAIETIKKWCSREDYESRKEAIIDNYNRVQHYLCLEDFIMEHYENKFIF